MNTYHHNLGLAFAHIAKTHATHTALSYQDHQYTYAHLLRWTESLSTLLLSYGINHGHVIAIAHNKHPLSYALMLAALRLGITYVNIDSTAPSARNLRILEVSQAALLCYDDTANASEMQHLAGQHHCQCIALTFDTLPELTSSDQTQQEQLCQKVDGASIAYIMFTSGSTGIPKGVAVTHQNVLHFIAWVQQYFQCTSQDNFANLNPMYFDNSVFDFYGSLFSGASLTPIHRELLKKPYDLVAYVNEKQCSIWFSVPSLLMYLMTMRAMDSTPLPFLRYFVFGGEGYPKVELKKLYDRFTKQAKLVNVYGPTECTCICSAYLINDQDFDDLNGLPPLGKLNRNFDYRILNEEGEDASKGELCLIGPNVTAGYFNDLKRTEAAFFTLTETNRFMKRMYKTGDLVEEVAGNLYFIARKDNQIKHMGYRIELEEIEHGLIKLPQVNQGAVVYQRTHTAYGKIIAFVSSVDPIDEPTLLDQLSDLLPEYMLPSRIFIKDMLPKNPNGKVDKQQLLDQIQEAKIDVAVS